jgi:hypothetical protein
MTRRSRDRFFVRLPDGTKIDEYGFDKFISKMVVGREYRRAVQRSKEIEEQAAELRERERALGECLVSANESEPTQIKPRSRNKLATNQTCADKSQLRFINPKVLIGGTNKNWHFSSTPKFLNFIPGITRAEREIYGWMIFRADVDGTFRRSIFSLSEDAAMSYRGAQKAVDSLERRPLILKMTDRAAEREANEYAFLYHEAMDQGGRTSEQCSLVLGDTSTPTSEQCSLELANSVRQTSEQCSHHNKQELSQEHEHDHVHVPVGLTPEQEDLINQINELTEIESRSEHFRTLWEMCVKEDQMAVFQAIGETRCMKREGKIKKTIGGTLRWHYKNFHAVRTKMKVPKR